MDFMKYLKAICGAAICGAAIFTSPAMADEIAPLPPNSGPDYTKFNGAYIGAHVGYAVGGHDYTYKDTDLGSLSQELSVHGTEYGGSVGWGHAFGRFYVGGELEASKVNAGSSMKIEVLGRWKEVDVDINYMYAGSLRAGYLLSEDTLAYAKAGVVRVHMERDRVASWGGDGALKKHKKWDTFPQFGVGIQHLMTDSISLKAEFGSAADSDTIVGLGRLGIAYHF